MHSEIRADGALARARHARAGSVPSGGGRERQDARSAQSVDCVRTITCFKHRQSASRGFSSRAYAGKGSWSQANGKRSASQHTLLRGCSMSGDAVYQRWRWLLLALNLWAPAPLPARLVRSATVVATPAARTAATGLSGAGGRGRIAKRPAAPSASRTVRGCILSVEARSLR